MAANEVEMIKCPICGEKWITEEYDFLCPECEEEIGVDLPIYDIYKDIEILEGLSPELIKRRIVLLREIQEKLANLVKKVENSNA